MTFTLEKKHITLQIILILCSYLKADAILDLFWSIKWVAVSTCPYFGIVSVYRRNSPSKDNLFRCCRMANSKYSTRTILTKKYTRVFAFCCVNTAVMLLSIYRQPYASLSHECSCNCTKFKENHSDYLFSETLWYLFYKHWLTLNSVWKSNSTIYEAWNEITYPYSNFNGYTVEDSEWISNVIPYFNQQVITYPYWGSR